MFNTDRARARAPLANMATRLRPVICLAFAALINLVALNTLTVRAEGIDAASQLTEGIKAFRAKNLTLALALFERGLGLANPYTQADTIARLHFNRAVTLSALERHHEAKDAYLASAQADPAMRTTALIMSAFEAYDAGESDEALSLAREAQGAPDANERVKELAQALQTAIHADTGATVPSSPSPTSNATSSAEKTHPHATPARKFIQETPWSANVELGGGYESNVSQAGAIQNAALIPSEARRASPYALASLSFGYKLRAQPYLLNVQYGFDQIAYTEAEVDPFSFQQHFLIADNQWQLSERWRAGLIPRANLMLTGLKDMTAMAWELGATGYAQFISSATLSTRLEFGSTKTQSLSDKFAFLGGHRIEAALSERLSSERVNAYMKLRLRSTSMGDQVVPAGVLSPLTDPVNVNGCYLGCESTYTIPLSYEAPAFTGALSYAFNNMWTVGTDVAAERRIYRDADVLTLTGSLQTFTIDGRARRDTRVIAGAFVWLTISPVFDVYLRYELIRNFSNIDNSKTNHALDYDNLNYVVHNVYATMGAHL